MVRLCLSDSALMRLVTFNLSILVVWVKPHEPKVRVRFRQTKEDSNSRSAVLRDATLHGDLWLLRPLGKQFTVWYNASTHCTDPVIASLGRKENTVTVLLYSPCEAYFPSDGECEAESGVDVGTADVGEGRDDDGDEESCSEDVMHAAVPMCPLHMKTRSYTENNQQETAKKLREHSTPKQWPFQVIDFFRHNLFQGTTDSWLRFSSAVQRHWSMSVSGSECDVTLDVTLDV